VRPIGWIDKHGLALTVGFGFAIRVYLSLTNFCISGDGAAYIRMAQEYAAGQWRKPLGAVFSPLYPLFIAAFHALGLNWELAGNLVSALAGTGALVTVYLMMREAFARDDLALGAAALTAIHPGLAAYSASVRNEAGLILLTTASVWLMLRAMRLSSLSWALASGAVAGIGYLYRTEAIGMIVLMIPFPMAASMFWKRPTACISLLLSLSFGCAAGAFVAPYVIMLHSLTGHWTVGREFTAAVMYGIAGASSNTAQWKHLGYSPSASPLAMMSAHPSLYLKKVGIDVGLSFYGFAQATGPVLIPLLAMGLWARGRKLFSAPAEVLLAVLVIGYFGGFTLSSTGARFMSHLIPYTFGWVILGLEVVTLRLQEFAARGGLRLPSSVPALVLALFLLPQTLWPIGYDMRGIRYAGEAIAAENPTGGAVVARDGRVAWYAHAPFVALPVGSVPDLCTWLKQHAHASYLLIGERDELHFAVSPAVACLDFIRRYPRYGAGYYDLFAVGQSPPAR
jgi:hypothetical protein